MTMFGVGVARGGRPWVLGLAVLLGACASPPGKAPVEDRSWGSNRPSFPAEGAAGMPAPGTADASPQAQAAPPGSENAGKPGYYTVKPGDALIRIGLEVGQNWRDLARWNALDNPNRIEVGQVLRVVPPESEPAAAVASPAVAVASPVAVAPSSRVIPATATDPAAGASPVGPAASAPGPASAAAPVTPTKPARSADDDIAWIWPASGALATPFEEGRTKGVAIAGKAGDPVLAAADGRVVYAGSGLRGYGNLVIVKHNATFLSAYAHNQALLVREDQVVRRGQRIAEMGSSDAPRVQLHFEIRRQGRPVDPLKLLPAR